MIRTGTIALTAWLALLVVASATPRAAGERSQHLHRHVPALASTPVAGERVQHQHATASSLPTTTASAAFDTSQHAHTSGEPSQHQQGVPASTSATGPGAVASDPSASPGGVHAGHKTGEHSSGMSAATAPLGSVLAMDVFAQGDTVDLLLAVQTAAGAELQHQRSRDGAQTWSSPVTIDRGGRSLLPPKRGNDAQIAAAGDTLLVAWTQKGPSTYGAGALAAARSTDGGRTWQATSSPADARGESGQGFTDLAATIAGTFFAVWLDDRDGSRGLRLARSTDRGRTWEPNVTLDAHTCECCWNTLATFDATRVAVLYRDAGPRDMALAVSADAGKSWTPRGVVGKFAWRFEGCPHVGGGLAQSMDEASLVRSRSGPDDVSALGRVRADQRDVPSAAARRTRASGTSWHALVWTGAEGQEGIYVLRSTDEGRTWAPPTRLGGPLGQHGAIVAHHATVTAAWDALDNGTMTIQSSSSSDGGITWSAPQRLSTGGSATHPILVSTSRGVVAFWTERDPNSDRLTWVARPLASSGS